MSTVKQDPVTGRTTTGHEWNGIEELETPIPRVVFAFLAATFVFAVICWVLYPTWPLGSTFTKGLTGFDQRNLVTEQVAKADAAKDPAAAAERLTDSALAARETDYRLRDVAGHTALGALPDKPVKVILPEAYDGWPRTFFAVIETGDVILSVTQEDPWSPYKVTNQAELVSQASLNLAPAYVGAIAIDPDSPFLALAPNKVAAAYADILTNGDSSPFAGQFDATNDPFRKLVADNRAARLESFNQTGAQTGTLSFAASAGPDEPISLATLDSGAIVAVTVHESDTVKPTNTDAVIKLDNNPIVQTLTGVNQSSSGFTTTFVDQLFFFVPSQSSNKRIQLLGYSTSILDAKVVS